MVPNMAGQKLLHVTQSQLETWRKSSGGLLTRTRCHELAIRHKDYQVLCIQSIPVSSQIYHVYLTDSRKSIYGCIICRAQVRLFQNSLRRTKKSGQRRRVLTSASPDDGGALLSRP
jgi:hypothetical protein